MMVYTASPFIGPEVGPLVGGFIVEHTTWRQVEVQSIPWNLAGVGHYDQKSLGTGMRRISRSSQVSGYTCIAANLLGAYTKEAVS